MASESRIPFAFRPRWLQPPAWAPSRRGSSRSGSAEALAAILGSEAAKKLIVAGPGAGKTHTFREALLACGGRGLALTFIRNLVADLADALGDIADVFTFHGFCKHQIHRHPVAGLQEGWDYYPPLLDLITVDLQLLGRTSMTKKRIEDHLHDLNEADGVIAAALELGNYYNAVSHTDLDLASESERGSELRAAIGQQELADAVGTVREVVVRALRDVREEGVLRTGRGGIVILDPERLAAEAFGGPAGAGVPGEWNPGR